MLLVLEQSRILVFSIGNCAQIIPITSHRYKCLFKWHLYIAEYVAVKQEILDEDENDVKPKTENGEIKLKKESEIKKMKNPELLTVQDILQSKEPELIFLQVCL